MPHSDEVTVESFNVRRSEIKPLVKKGVRLPRKVRNKIKHILRNEKPNLEILQELCDFILLEKERLQDAFYR